MFSGFISAFLLAPALAFPSFGAWGDANVAFAQSNTDTQREERSMNQGWWGDWRNEDRPSIDEISPSEAEAGDEITLTGENFEDESTVRLGGNTMIDDVTIADDGMSLTFLVPEGTSEGNYKVRVITDEGRSNAVRLSVVEDDDDDGPLSIVGIDGPTSLEVGAEGTWTVDVEGEDLDGNLMYSVKWGDEGWSPLRLMSSDDEDMQASATFTHIYEDEGTFTPEFTVTDEDGDTVTKASASVEVGDADGDDPVVTSVSPTSAKAGATTTITGTGFDADSEVFLNGGKLSSSSVEVKNDTTITFIVPDQEAKEYELTVKDDDGESTPISFTIEAKEIKSRVSVSGVNAPTQLEVGEEGTWTVDAKSSLGGNLRYSVDWGDDPAASARMASSDAMEQSSATFTHTYEDAGTYKPKFTVTDENGTSASVSATVTVSADDDEDDES